MASLAEVEQRRQATLDLTTLAMNDTNYLVRELANEDPVLVMQTLREYLPQLVDPYAAAIGELTVTDYMNDRTAAGITSRYAQQARAVMPTAARTQALAGWVGQTLIDNPELIAYAGSKLAGGVSRLLFDVQRETTWDLAAGDSGLVRYQRMASPGCCAFCAMLASRGAVYSEDSVMKVIGRGVPVGRDVEGNRIDGAGRGRTGKGIKERGMQRIGENYHDHCVVPGTMVSGPPSQVGYRRHYEGELITLVTAMGYELSITPKHPVLTDRGWVPAGLLNVGDQLVSAARIDRNVVSGPDVDHMPSRIEDVVRALSMMRSATRRTVPGTAEQFHGDGSDSEVNVVAVDNLLGDELDSPLLQPFSKLDLHRASLALARERLAGPGVGNSKFARPRLGDPSDGGVRRLREVLPLCRSHARQTENVGFGGGSLLQTKLSDPAVDDIARDTVMGGHRQDTRAGGVPTGEVTGRVNTVARKFDPVVPEGAVESSSVYAELGSDLRDRLAGSVRFDRVVDVRVSDYHGDVLNLETNEGWYSANGITVANCRCVGVAVHEGRMQQMNEAAEKWYEIYADAFHSANDKFEYGHESWTIPVTYDVNGKKVTYNEIQSRHFWVDDREGTTGYGDEVDYKAFQSQLLADMRKIAADDYDMLLK